MVGKTLKGLGKKKKKDRKSDSVLQDLDQERLMEESSIKNGSSLPPFLAKCYEIVDDPLTDSIISWNPNDSSFVIWDLILFQRELLPNYFKHGNFSSFLRQLNTYGFRKSDPDRWEFINDGFIKGQKHLLKNINRRKSSQSLTQQKQLQQKNTSIASCVEVGKFGLWEEVEILKRDKILLKQEMVKLRQHQLGADGKLLHLRRRLQGMEINQQQMLSLLAMAMQSPGFLAQLLQQNESNWCIAETSKKRPLCALEQSTDDVEPIASDGQIVRYKPPEKEIPKPLLMAMSNMDGSQQLDPCPNDFFMNIDFMSFGEGVSVPMEEDLPSENDGPLILSDLLEDGIMDQLLLSSPFLENTEETELNTPETLENEMELDSTNHDTCVETSQTLGL